MNKLIKLSDIHYIVVDDSEIKTDDYFWSGGIIITRRSSVYMNITKEDKLITHSFGKKLKGVINKPLSEVEEAIYGYSVEKMAKENITGKDLHSVDMRIGFERGFKAHQELVKHLLPNKTEWNVGVDKNGKIIVI